MAWRGFYLESKSLMCYSNMTPISKIKFWVKYPIAYYKYIKLMTKDSVKNMLTERKIAEESL